MEFYQTTQTVRLPAGIILLLNAGQFNARAHLLEPKVDGLTTAKEPVEFKAGEIIGLAQVPLALKTALEPVEFEDGEFGDWELTDFLLDESEGPVKSSTEEQSDNSDHDGQMLSELSPVGSVGGETMESVISERPDNADPGEQILPVPDGVIATTDIDQAIVEELSPGDAIGVEKATESVIDESQDNGEVIEQVQSEASAKPKPAKKAG
jgi:hypothetical protein